eukprot:TRINITY_DN1608_c0_g1_i4.p1 TRINITY_DN1608_c0_g1~~TRINITY_DN1608_c0_g1_i4.p1  ORF type:complete len:792 (+),score=237.94 TRINITY_DN1608_c0_g1_i4:374-2749(+)
MQDTTIVPPRSGEPQNTDEASPRRSGLTRSASHPGISQSADSINLKIKKKYTTDELLSFKPQNLELPEGHTSYPLDIIKDSMSAASNIRHSGSGIKGPASPQIARNSPKPGRNNRGGQNAGGGRGGHKKSASIGSSGSFKQNAGGGRGGRGGSYAGKNVPQENLPPVAPLVPSENRWVRPKEADDKEVIFRNAQGILNKLTLEHFDSLSEKLLNVGIDSAEILQGIIHQIFAKALQEPHFSTMYADLCSKLSTRVAEFPPENEGEKPMTFRRLLIENCQREFEGASKPIIDENLSPQEKVELEMRAKKKYLGNIKFIGELYKQKMLPEKIMHFCIESQLKELEDPVEDDIESLCKLIVTVGKILDTQESGGAAKVDTYFARLSILSNNMKLSSRIRFMARDVIDLRNNNWVPRRKENEAKTLAAARAEVLNAAAEAASPAPSPAVGRASLRRSDSRDAGSQDFREEGRSALRSSRDNMANLKKGDRALPRSQSANDLGNEFENSPARSRNNRNQIEKKPSQEGWEVVGGGKGNKYDAKGGRGFGRGMQSSPSVDRIPKTRSEVYPPREKEAIPVRKNIFSALSTDFDQSPANSPRSALRRSMSGTGTAAPSAAPKKAVAIKTPEEEPTFKQSPQNLDKKVGLLLEEFLSSADSEEALACLQDLNAPDYHGEVVAKAVSLAIEKKERDRDEIVKLFEFLQSKQLLTAEDFEKGFTSVLENIEDIDLDLPHASKYTAKMMAQVMSLENSLPVSFLEDALRPLVSSGKAANVFAGVFDNLARIKVEPVVVLRVF